MRKLTLLLLLAVPLWSQQNNFTGSSSGTGIVKYTVATLPTSATLRTIVLVTDGLSNQDCTSGGGAGVVPCLWNGSAWIALVIQGANSISAGTTPAGVASAATGGFACTEATNNGWTPTAGTDYIRCDNTLHTFVKSENGGAETALGNGSGTVTSSTVNQVARYNASSNTVIGSTKFTDDLTTAVYSGTGGFTSLLFSTNDASRAGYVYTGAGTAGAIPANSFMIEGAPTITTGFGWTTMAGENASAGLLHLGAAAAHKSAMTVSVVTPTDATGNTSGSGNFCLATSCVMTTPNIGTATATSVIGAANTAVTYQAGLDAATVGSTGVVTLRGENVSAGGTNNLAGGAAIIAGGVSTGTATPAPVKIQSTALGLASANTAQPLITRYVTHVKAGSTTSATPTTLFNIASATNTAWGVEILVHVDLISSTPNVCGTTEHFSLTGTNNNSAFGTVNIVAGTISTLCSTGTLTLAISATAANPSVISVTPTWGTITTITSATITVQIYNVSQQEIALL